MCTPSARSDVFVWWVTSNGPSPVATMGALYTVDDPSIRMNGLYPCLATAPGWKLASGKPCGPGVATRLGLKSGAPLKSTTADPKRFCAGVGDSRLTVCTQSGQLLARLASFG